MFEYHMFYVLYLFVTYLLTSPRISCAILYIGNIQVVNISKRRTMWLKRWLCEKEKYCSA
jgi:hypothetical protein